MVEGWEHETSRLKRLFADLSLGIEALKDFQQESAKQQFERAKQVLMNDKKDALKEGDHDAVVEIVRGTAHPRG